MHVAHFVQRYPPALGGSEAYFARLGDYLADHGDAVRVWTTTALDLEAFWTRGMREAKNLTPPPSLERKGGRGGRTAPVTGRVSGIGSPFLLRDGGGGVR